MSRKLAPWLVAVAAAAITAVTATPASADVIIPIRPHQHFEGLVNGKTNHALIRTNCFSPGPGPIPLFGHPLRGQTVEVVRDADSDGFTGSAASQIDVYFPSPSLLNPPVVLRAYDVPATIPVSLVVPCFGTAKVQFLPTPTSPTAVTETVDVTFEGLPWPPPAV